MVTNNSLLLMLLMVSVSGQAYDECDLITKTKCYRNFPRNSFYRQCPPEFLVSVYEFKKYEAIRGKLNIIMCLRTGPNEDCKMSGPLNKLGQSFEFKCHTNAAITAITYDYNYEADDGIFKVECCKFRGRKVTRCEQWDESTGFAQYIRSGSTGILSHYTHPAIAGFSSLLESRWGLGYNYKARKFTLDMCTLE